LLAIFMTFGTALGCAAVPGIKDRYVVCPYDAAWNAALDSLKDRSVTVKDRDKGVIETGWLEVPIEPRNFGAFRREIKDARDRSRLVVTLTRINEVTKVSLSEDRERWAWRGGSRLFGWTPAEPSEETMSSVMNRINSRLKESGCPPA
jgi:hypothetical protein